MLPGILGFEPYVRRTALDPFLPESRDLDGQVITDHSYLLTLPVAPADGVIHDFKLQADIETSELDLFDYSQTRGALPHDAAAVLADEFKKARAAAVAGLLNGIGKDGVRALYTGAGGGNLKLSEPVTVPLCLLYGLHFSDADLLRTVQRLKPAGYVEIGAEEFAAGIAARKAAIRNGHEQLKALRETPGRFDDAGRDLWLTFTATLLFFNERSIKPCDPVGRATKDAAILKFMAELNFENAAGDLREEWFSPDESHHLYRSPDGRYFMNYAASQGIGAARKLISREVAADEGTHGLNIASDGVSQSRGDRGGVYKAAQLTVNGRGDPNF